GLMCRCFLNFVFFACKTPELFILVLRSYFLKGSVRYMDKDVEKKDGKQEEDQHNSSALIEKIQQLGQTNIPQSPDSNIHVMLIIGQVEGHIQLPPQNKTTKY